MPSHKRLMQHELNVNGILDVFQLVGLCLNIFLNLHIFYLYNLVFNFVSMAFLCVCCVHIWSHVFLLWFFFSYFFCLFVLSYSDLFAFTLSYFILLSFLFRFLYSKWEREKGCGFWAIGEALGGVGEEEIVIRIYHIKEILFSIKHTELNNNKHNTENNFRNLIKLGGEIYCLIWCFLP